MYRDPCVSFLPRVLGSKTENDITALKWVAHLCFKFQNFTGVMNHR